MRMLYVNKIAHIAEETLLKYVWKMSAGHQGIGEGIICNLDCKEFRKKTKRKKQTLSSKKILIFQAGPRKLYTL